MLWLLIPLASPAAHAAERTVDLAADPYPQEVVARGDEVCFANPSDDELPVRLLAEDAPDVTVTTDDEGCITADALSAAKKWIVRGDGNKVLAKIEVPWGGDDDDEDKEEDDGSVAGLPLAWRDKAIDRARLDQLEPGHDTDAIGHRSYRVVLGPDGAPLWPLPREVAEGDVVVVHMVTADQVSPSVAVQSCPKVEPFRVNGSWAEATSEAQRGDEAVPPAPKMQSHQLGRFTCGAGDVKLEVVTQAGWDDDAELTATVEWSVAETYQATAAVSLGYDTSPVSALYLEKGAEPETGATQEYTLRRSQNRQGMQADAVMIFHPTGYTPGRINALDALVNPTIGLPFDSVTDLDAVFIGDSIMVPGLPGIWVTAGWQIQSVIHPKEGSDYAVGQTTTTSDLSDIPTEQSWRSLTDGDGFFAGISIDIATFSRLKGKAETGSDDRDQDDGES